MMHVIAAKAVAFKEALQPEFVEYQKIVVDNAKALAKRLIENGYKLVSDGTDNHMMLVDLRNKRITGIQAETLLDEVNITVNKNAVPFDPEKPQVTSGIRIGTPAVTTRGMNEATMGEIADIIHWTLAKEKDPAEIREAVEGICERFPLYN